MNFWRILEVGQNADSLADRLDRIFKGIPPGHEAEQSKLYDLIGRLRECGDQLQGMGEQK